MINEILEFKSYVTDPECEIPRLQPKMFTDDFGNTGNLFDLEHVLTTIVRGFIYDVYSKLNSKFDETGMISDDLIVCVGKVIFEWFGFECVNDYMVDENVIDKWNETYPQVNEWLKKYYQHHCTKKDCEKRWKKIEEKWEKSLRGNDYRVSAVSINDIIANALELGPLQEYCLIIKKNSEVVKSTKLTNRFGYLYSIKENTPKPQEKTIERLLKNIAAYLYLKKDYLEGQKFVLLDRIQLLCWYGLDDNKNDSRNWYFKNFLFDKNNEMVPIMAAHSGDRGWSFIKFKIDDDFIAKNEIKIMNEKDIDSIDKDKYWIIKDNGHGKGSICCVESY